jgi:TDG/mug DNA glycosylase family protein
MLTLPDVVSSGLTAVFCGTAVGDCQALPGHHHAGRGDSFWALLNDSGLTPRRLLPSDEHELLAYGLGLVDLLPQPGRELPPVAFDVDALEAKVAALRPRWVVLTSKRTGSVVARALGKRPPSLGATGWSLAGSAVFVAPSSSGANRRRDYDGRRTRLAWWSDLHPLFRDAGSAGP